MERWRSDLVQGPLVPLELGLPELVPPDSSFFGSARRTSESEAGICCCASREAIFGSRSRLAGRFCEKVAASSKGTGPVSILLRTETSASCRQECLAVRREGRSVLLRAETSTSCPLLFLRDAVQQTTLDSFVLDSFVLDSFVLDSFVLDSFVLDSFVLDSEARDRPGGRKISRLLTVQCFEML